MAHIERRGAGRWRARYRAPDGSERSRTFGRKLDAERFIASIEVEKLKGHWVDPRLGKVTFAEWSERWMATVVNLRPKTVAGYHSLLRYVILPVFGPVPLSRIDPVLVRERVAKEVAKGRSASRVRQAYNLLGAILRSAVESGHIARSPCIGVKVPRIHRREMRFLSANEVERLVQAVGPEWSTFVFVLAYGGLRFGEAVALRRSSVDLLRSRLHVTQSLSEVTGQLLFGPTKTHQSRVVVLPRFLRELLAAHLTSVPADPDALSSRRRVEVLFGSAPSAAARGSRRPHRPAWRRSGSTT